PNGDEYINRYSRDHIVQRQPLHQQQPSQAADAERSNNARLVVSLLPERSYTLEELVSAHRPPSIEHSPRGRSLIIDRVNVAQDEESLSAGWRLALEFGLNIVMVTATPDPVLWERCESRLIFGFDRRMPLSKNPVM